MSDENKLSRRDFIKDAAIGAAAVAGASVLGAAPAEAQTSSKPWLPAKWDYEADLVVIGFGAAAWGASIAARDLGASVIILEKAPERWAGGNSSVSGNARAGQLNEDINHIRALCWGTVTDEELLKTYVRAVHECPAWVEKLGHKVYYAPPAPYTSVTLPGGPSISTACYLEVNGKGGAGYDNWAFYKPLIEKRGIKIMYSTPATELIQDPVTKEILGVKALTEVETGKDYHYTGGKQIFVKGKKAVVLACGGHENNPEILHSYGPFPHSAYVTFYGSPFNTGDGFMMAQRVGAKMWHMAKKEVHDFACVPASKELFSGVSVRACGTQIGATASIIVNRDGKRFMNEYFYSGHGDNHRKYDEFEHKVKADDDYDYADYRNVPMYWIFDSSRMKTQLRTATQWVGVKKVYEWSKDNQAELAKGWFIQADTIEALAKKIVVKDFFGRVVGMDAAGLVETVKKYNEYCAAGKDLDFGRRPSTMKPLVTPPFYAMEVCECQTNTMGGPMHNKFSQTLDVDEKPIPRLYSAGELGSMWGHLYQSGRNVTEALAFGKIAGEHAVTLKPWDSAT